MNKPRVAVYYHVLPSTGFRNDGAPGFATYNLRKILDGDTKMNRSDGNVVHLWPNKAAENFGKFDLHLWIDYGEDALGLPLDWYPPKERSAYWISDAHLGYKYRMETAKKFEHVFVAQKEFIEQLVSDGVPRETIHYLPHAFEPDIYKPTEIIKKWDWSFIGHLNSPHRIDLLDRLCKEFPNWYLGWRNAQAPGYNSLEDAAWKLSQSLVGVNYSVKKDLNMRVFETMGTKTCLLTDDVPDIRDLFEDHRHLVLFSNVDEAVDSLRRLIKNDEMRNFIADQGYKEVLANHTYQKRVEKILEICIDYIPEKKGELQPCL